MEKEKKVYFHYNHTDSSKSSRWTARESFQFMHARSWQQVVDFYSNVVNGHFSLLELSGTQMHFVHNDDDDAKLQEFSNETKLEDSSNKDKFGRWARVAFKIVLSYHGASFDGWQKQPGLNTVQSLVENSLGRFVDEKKSQQLKDKCKPLEGWAVVAGRTDKGVSALHQACSFYTWRNDVRPNEIEDAINCSAPGKLRVISVSQVLHIFHPNFSAKWRRYLYIFPLNDEENREELENFSSNDKYIEPRHGYGEITKKENVNKSFILRRISLKLCTNLGYSAYAASTSFYSRGPPTECFIFHAQATEARLPCSDNGEGRRVMCIELVANRLCVLSWLLIGSFARWSEFL